MSEMVERVINALAAVAGKTGGCGSDRCCCFGLEAFECKTGLTLESFARAAIEAMREPTEEMKSCSEEIHWGYSCHTCGGLTEGWHKMIDAALS